MGYRYEINEDEHVLFLYRFGNVDKSELRTSAEHILSVCDSKNINCIVNDLTEADFSTMSTDDLDEHGRFIGRELSDRNIRIAIIAPSDLTFGLARMFEAFAELDSIMVFRTKEEAVSWLEV